MSASTPVQPDHSSQDGTTYKTSIDDGFAVARRIAWAFAPHEQATPDMTVRLEAGVVPKVGDKALDVGAQSTATITAPIGNPRRDIVYVDAAAGTVGVATGAEAPTPSDPPVPAGKIAVARVNLTVGMSEIVNADIDDLRNPGLLGLAAALASTGLEQADGRLELDVAGLSTETLPASDDVVAIEDVSAAAKRKLTLADLLKVIDGLSEDAAPDTANDVVATYDASASGAKKVRLDDLLDIAGLAADSSPATGDELVVQDVSVAAKRKVTLANLFKVVNGLSEDTAPDPGTDFVATYDASAAAARKVKLTNVLDIAGQTAETSPATGDELAVRDVSVAANRKMTLGDLLTVVNALSEDTGPDGNGDFIATYDASAAAAKKVTPENLFKVIDGFGEVTAPDEANDLVAIYDSSASAARKVRIANLITQRASPQGYISGLTLAVNAADGAHDVDIAPGVCRDSSDAEDLVLGATLTKQVDASWAQGGNAGGMFSGTVAANTWYHVFLIRKDSDGAIDAGFDTDVGAANAPSGWSTHRRIGSIRTNLLANLKQWVQGLDTFWWANPPEDVDMSTLGDSAQNATLTVPPGVKVLAIVNAVADHASAGRNVYLSSPDVTNLPPTVDGSPGTTIRAAGGTLDAHQVAVVLTDTAARIRGRASDIDTTLRIITLGWRDPLGRW